MNSSRAILASLLLATIPVSLAQTRFSVAENGFAINADAMGNFGIEAPVLNTAMGEEKAVFAKTGAQSGTFEYASGMRLEGEVKGRRIDFHFSKATPGSKSLKFVVLIPMNYNLGGSYAFDAAPLKSLPFEKSGQFVQHGNATTFTVVDPSGLGFVIGTPGGYQGLQDNRTFGWPVFGYHYQYDFNGRAEGDFHLAIQPFSAPASAAPENVSVPNPSPKFLADRFGQSFRKDYPGKVKSEEELKADGVKQLAEIAAFKPDPKLDAFGGLAGSGKKYSLEKTGFFHLGRVGERQVLVSPEGNLFFQMAVCGIAGCDDFTAVKGRENVYEWLPKAGDGFDTAWRENHPDWGDFSFYAANLIRKFGKPFSFDEWTGQVVRRLRSWGFNSAGAFAEYTGTMRKMDFPYVGFLPLGEGGGVEMLPDRIGASELLDPFVPGTEASLEKKFAGTVATNANDPLLIGYFLGNEQHFEILPKLIPTYKASKVAAKGCLVEMLKEKYKDIGKFNAAWSPAVPFTDFTALGEAPLFVRTAAGDADMLEFYRLYLETYYSMVRRVFKKFDTGHLLIGSRLTPGTANNKDAVEIGGKYLDVMSINYYEFAMEEAFLKRAHDWSGGKPIILSEWHFASTDHGLGSHMEVRDEKERGMAFRNYVEQAAAMPFIVGTQWFIYTDQALTGRFFEGFHGEGNNTGLVDVADRPYTELVQAAKVTHDRVYDVMLGKEKAFAFDDPRFGGSGKRSNGKTVQIPKALPGMKLDGTTSNWPGCPAEPIASGRNVLGPPNPDLRAEFRTCWDETNLYLHVQVTDKSPLKNNHEGDSLWAADAVELFVGAGELDNGRNIIFTDRHILLGASEHPSVLILDHAEDSAKYRVLAVKDVSGDGYVLQAAIPWKVLGVEPKPGTEMKLDVMVDNSDDGEVRLQQLAWNGSSQNSSERGSWGRARITDN